MISILLLPKGLNSSYSLYSNKKGIKLPLSEGWLQILSLYCFGLSGKNGRRGVFFGRRIRNRKLKGCKEENEVKGLWKINKQKGADRL